MPQIRTMAALALAALAVSSSAGFGDYPDFKDVAEDFEKVVSPPPRRASLYSIWVREKDGQMLAELPRGYARQKHFFAMTVSGGEIFAGLQAGDMYVYWKQYGDNRLALLMPEMGVALDGRPGVQGLGRARSSPTASCSTSPSSAWAPAGSP
jgi:hypothetical protein